MLKYLHSKQKITPRFRVAPRRAAWRVAWLMCVMMTLVNMRIASGQAVSPVPPVPATQSLPDNFSTTPAVGAPIGLDPDKAITQYSQDNWRTEHGLPQNTVMSILATRDGYIWLGTYEGLARFDGIKFKLFDKASVRELKNSSVLALAESRDSTLWIGTNGGGVTAYKAGKFTTYTVKEGLANDFIKSITEDREGNIWIGTNRGLSKFKAGKFTNYTTEQGLAHNVVRAIRQSADGAIWIGTNGGGLSRFKEDKFTTYTTKDSLPSNFIFSLCTARDGTLWIGTNGDGLCQYKDGVFKTYKVSDGLPNPIILSLFEDRYQTLWIGTYGGGLARWRNGKIERYSAKQGLPNDFVRAIHEDREGSLWIGTAGGGLGRLKMGKFVTHTSKEGLSSDFTRTLIETRDSALWIGTADGGLNRIAPDGGITFFSEANGLPDKLVQSLAQDTSGAVWVGTSRGAARIKEGKVKVFTESKGPTGGLTGNRISSMCSDGAGGMWIGIVGGGLCHVAADETITTYTDKNGLPSNLVLTVFRSRSGAVWIGMDGCGLVKFEHGKFTPCTKQDGLASDIVFCVYEDTSGTLWIGTSGGGLSRMKQGKFESLTSTEGLFEDTVFNILEDDDGWLWLSGNKGITRLNKKNISDFLEKKIPALTPIQYGMSDGMKSSECSAVSQPSSFRRKDGSLWFSTTKGLVAINPRQILRNDVVPLIVIEDVRAEGQSLLASGAAKLKPGTERFEVQYAGLSLYAPEKVRFRYKLDGFDKKWIDGGKRREAFYTNLPPGIYTFRVMACNSDGVWNESGASLRIELEPYFYQTATFYLGAAMLLVFGGVGLYRFRMKQVSEREAELLAEVELRTKDLRLQQAETESALTAAQAAREDAERQKTSADHQRREAERQRESAQSAGALKSELLSMAAHDLKNPLQTVMGFASLTNESVPEDSLVATYARHIFDASRRMVDLIESLLRTAALDTGNLELHKSAVDISRLVLSVITFNQPQAERKGQEIVAHLEPDCTVTGDEERLHEVVDNLIGNAIKYSPLGKKIFVAVRKAAPDMAATGVAADGNGSHGEKSVVIEVRDEGQGLTEMDKAKLFGRFQRLSAKPTGGESSTGLGLAIVKQLIELHGGSVSAESGGQGQGSRFIVRLPVQSENKQSENGAVINATVIRN
ncbi:MAG: hypothetical protein IAF08_13175 [Rhizobacter sp.]|nr:hypothetical protein [Chlorobiales bacterium]